MPIPNPRIEKFRGDTWRITVEVVDYDLTGATFAAQAKKEFDAVDGVINFACTPDAENPNQIVCTATPQQTQDATAGDYLWDLELTQGGDVTTIARAIIEVSLDVTQGA